MNRYKSPIAQYLFLVLIAFSTTYAYAGLPKLTPSKKWSEQRLTWDDFQVRHIPTDTLIASYISMDLETTQKTAWIGNTRFEYTHFSAVTYPTSSWYDPDRATQWDLMSENVRFDIAELNARLLQREYNRSYDDDVRQQAQQHAWNEAEQRFREFNVGTDYLRDTAAILQYAQNITRELNMLPRTEPTIIPTVEYGWYYGFLIGYNYMNPIGVSRNNLTPSHNIELAMYFGYRNFEVQMGVRGGGKIRLSQPGYFRDNDYVWYAGKTNLSVSYLDLGYQVLSGQYFRLAPFAGIGSCTFHQDDPVYPDDADKKHQARGFIVDAGFNADYILMRDLNVHFNSFRYFLKIRPFASYAHIGNREIWSANISLTFSFDTQLQKHPQYYIE